MNDELFLALGRLEGKVDALLQMQRLQEEQLKSHDERLRNLEHSRSFALGLAASVGAGTSALLNLFWNKP
jgi:pantothenate kinase